jgi:hypothetical protein
MVVSRFGASEESTTSLMAWSVSIQVSSGWPSSFSS